jgi:hypothetical protein
MTQRTKPEEFLKIIKLSELPPSCVTDSTVCGDFFLEGCFLKEVVDNGGIIQES